MAKVGVVIPVGAGREDNLRRCLASLSAQTLKPDAVMVVFDGADAVPTDASFYGGQGISWCVLPAKHTPGEEQPRNYGVRGLPADIDAVWFVDSDIIFGQRALRHMMHVWEPGCITIAPYEWLPPGVTEPQPDLHNDPRWGMFNEWPEDRISVGELNVGLACFSGNLMWDIRQFKMTGGFWNDLHHGRCEDGELGLRAVAEGVPIKAAPRARGYHVHHEVNLGLIHERNTRDVPMLNARHPWVEQEGLRVVHEDGKRFDVICPRCRAQMNTLVWWGHTCP